MDQNENPNSSDTPSEPPLDEAGQSPPSNSMDSSMSDEPSMSEPEMPSMTPEPTVVSPASSDAMVSPENADTMQPMPSAKDTTSSEGNTSSPEVAKSGGPKKRLWRKAALISAIIVVLLGGSAAAFFTVYLPAQPWYVLDTALKNTLAATNLAVNASANVTASNSITFKLTSLTSADLNNKTADEDIGVTVAGVTIPLELRLVNSNLYFKFGDLSSVSSLAALASGSVGSLGSSLSPLLSSLSNQWVVVDSTLLDQSKTIKCFLNSSWLTSDADSNYMVNSYLKQPFFTVKTMTSDTLNAQAENKMSVTMNDDQAAAYIAGLSNLSSSKSFDQCTGHTAASTGTTTHKSSLADNQIRPLTIWVNKSTKRIDKIEFATTTQDSKKGAVGTVDATFSYGAVNIQAPSNAVPVTQLLAELVQGLTKSGNSSALNSLSPLLNKL